MIDLMLRFSDESSAIIAMSQYRDETGWVLATHEYALDLLGPVEVVPATIDPVTGDIASPPVIDGRWHCNLRIVRGDCPPGLDFHKVNPSVPARVWATGREDIQNVN